VSLRKEQVLLLATVSLLAAFLWNMRGADSVRARRSHGEEVELVRYAAPDVSLARPRERAGRSGDRDLFSPPRDTRPLPLLEFVPPPLPTLGALRPPPDPGVAPAWYGRTLRADPTPREVPDLFAEETPDEAFDDELAPAGSAAAAGDEPGPLGALRDLADAMEAERRTLSPDERAARIAAWKRLYDWMRVAEGEPMFGRIENADRYGLAERPTEDLRFVAVDPETGLERFPGQQPASFARSRVLEFGFADTPSNRIQLRRREFDREITPSVYADLLAFADECVDLRLGAREALDVAEAMYRRAAAFDEEDPAPLLGLARCYEAGFRFEQAYATYLDLLQGFEHRPEVHVRLAQLEARLRLFDSAEQRLLRAERLARSDPGVQHAYGRFLLDRGRAGEAVEHLRLAVRNEPREPERGPTRARMRADLGRSLLARGELAEAADWFERAVQADPELPDADAGRLACRLLGVDAARFHATAGGDADFSTLLDRGLLELQRGEAATARDTLLLAAEADPLRAPLAWRGLSWLAETTGHPEEAYRWIEQAWVGDPTDAWTLYQRGRLLAARDDPEGAREAFTAALERELDFTDALVALGVESFQAGAFDDAERYFERALALDPERPEVHALRGTNHLRRHALDAALGSFDAALELDPAQPLALCGRAWVAYARGDAAVAITRFAELDDRRRSLPAEDPYRAFAQAQIARIQDHESEELWSDRFERRQLKNGWEVEEAAGPRVELTDGEVRVRGSFQTNGTARCWRRLPGADFVSFEMDVTVKAANNARVGVFLSKERRRGAGETEVQGMLSVGREKHGGLALLLMDTAQAEPVWEDVPEVGDEAWWPADRPVRIRLERIGEGSKAYGRLSVDGVIVREGAPLRRLVTSSTELRLGLFVEGQTGLPADVVADDVEMVYRVAR